jgi:hypothetical protein
MSKIIGIDLGTTNSCVAVIEAGEPVVIPNAEGARTSPSVVAFSKDGERMVGQVAKRQAITNPERTIASIKREMGSDHRVNIDGKAYTPQEISAMVLQKLKNDAESYHCDFLLYRFRSGMSRSRLFGPDRPLARRRERYYLSRDRALVFHSSSIFIPRFLYINIAANRIFITYSFSAHSPLRNLFRRLEKYLSLDSTPG